MELPVLIEPLPDRSGFTAYLAGPLELSATAATPEEAHHRLASLVQRRLQQGLELRSLNVPVVGAQASVSGWLPDDELTREWLQHVEDYRAECDAADRARLASAPQPQGPTS